MTSPTGRLRAISLTVEQHEPGAFRWVLLERRQEEWAELTAAITPDTTYDRAVAEGLVALQMLSKDLTVGPRDTPLDQGKDESTGKSKAAQRFFGFGHV